MQLDRVFDFLATEKLAIVSSSHASGAPAASLVGIALTADRHFVFDTSAASRKAANIRARSDVALVIGWDNETTVQIEGTASFAAGAAASRAKSAYFQVWPDGRTRETWPDIAYVVVKPRWLRYACYAGNPIIIEFDL